MTNYDLYKVIEGIKKCSEITNSADLNFAYTMARIEAEVSAELKIIEKAKKPISDKYKEYLKKKQEIDIKYAIQKEDGTYQTLGDSLIIRNPKEYNKEIDILNNDYKEELDSVKNINSEFEKFLQLECTTKITQLPKSCIPTSLTVEQMTLLLPVIVDK